ncbi:MAG: ATP-binding protein [Candidatus Dojkabacteria bacterium]
MSKSIRSGKQDFLYMMNPWWESPSFRYSIRPRPLYTDHIIKRNDNLIDILVGSRRVGKTHILYSVINHLLDTGVKPKNIIFLSADVREVRELGIRKTIAAVKKDLKINQNAQIHVLIDEVQDAHEWQNDLKTLFDHTKTKLYISGSSSLVLSQETYKLTGRYFMQKVFPLSFPEFLQFKKYSIRLSATRKLHALQEYLALGGYPEYILKGNQTYLRQAIESTLYRDLLTAYGIRNPAILEDLLYYLADKITTTVSAKTIQKDLHVDDETARFYLKYLESVYLIFPLYRFGSSHKITKSSNPKYYFNDTGVLNLMGKKVPNGLLMENAVFVEFLRKESLTERYKVFYDIVEGQEVDFRYQNTLYEVKSTRELPVAEMEKYADLGEKVSMIVLQATKAMKNYTTSLKFIELWDFMMSNS